MVKVGITTGDLNGIGPEIIIKSLKDNRILNDITPVIYSSSKVFSFYKKLINIDEFTYQSCKNSNEVILKKINIVNLWNEEVKIEPGVFNATMGKYSILSLQKAVEDLASNKIDVLVTAPVSKENLLLNHFTFPGQTEYLANYANSDKVLMLMISDNLKVALATSHIPLNDVSKNLTQQLIIEKIKLLDQSLKKDFGIIRPKIAVFGLNPHAGENGKMGEEEDKIISPAISKVKSENILAFGPFPSDSFFGSSSINKYDGVLAMYHDQGLTGFKALSFESGVNYTAGLPIVRTSPDHGTAFDIAGKNLASEQSFRNAIYSAIDIYKNRIFNKEINKNPLPFSKEGDKHNMKKSEIE